jgi:hypothetical protein
MKDAEVYRHQVVCWQRYRAHRLVIICCSYLPNCSIATIRSRRLPEQTFQWFSPSFARLYWHLKVFTIARLIIAKLKYIHLPQSLKILLLAARAWNSPLNWLYSYPAYERMLIVDLNKDTKTIINVVPTGSNPNFSQEQPTKKPVPVSLGTFPGCFFSYSRIYRILSHAPYNMW